MTKAEQAKYKSMLKNFNSDLGELYESQLNDGISPGYDKCSEVKSGLRNIYITEVVTMAICDLIWENVHSSHTQF